MWDLIPNVLTMLGLPIQQVEQRQAARIYRATRLVVAARIRALARKGTYHIAGSTLPRTCLPFSFWIYRQFLPVFHIFTASLFYFQAFYSYFLQADSHRPAWSIPLLSRFGMYCALCGVICPGPPFGIWPPNVLLHASSDLKTKRIYLSLSLCCPSYVSYKSKSDECRLGSYLSSDELRDATVVVVIFGHQTIAPYSLLFTLTSSFGPIC